jgi:Mg2+ and Co2+ transporter CorA
MRIVEEYSVAEWRLRRAWTLIAALIDNRMDSMAADLDQTYEQLDHATRAALAHDHSTKTTMSLRELENHVSRYSRATDRAIRRLQHLRKLAPPAAPLQFPTNEPKEL